MTNKVLLEITFTVPLKALLHVKSGGYGLNCIKPGFKGENSLNRLPRRPKREESALLKFSR